jgi:hypothetical protein
MRLTDLLSELFGNRDPIFLISSEKRLYLEFKSDGMFDVEPAIQKRLLIKFKNLLKDRLQLKKLLLQILLIINQQTFHLI